MYAHTFLYKGIVKSRMIKNIYYILYEKKDKIDKGVSYSTNVIQIKTIIAIYQKDSTRDSLDLLPKNHNKNVKRKNTQTYTSPK